MFTDFLAAGSSGVQWQTLVLLPVYHVTYRTSRDRSSGTVILAFGKMAEA